MVLYPYLFGTKVRNLGSRTTPSWFTIGLRRRSTEFPKDICRRGSLLPLSNTILLRFLLKPFSRHDLGSVLKIEPNPGDLTDVVNFPI